MLFARIINQMCTGLCHRIVNPAARIPGGQVEVDLHALRSEQRRDHIQVTMLCQLWRISSFYPKSELDSFLFRGSIHTRSRCREEMEDVVGSVFDLMGRTADPLLEEEVISQRVDIIFEVIFPSTY